MATSAAWEQEQRVLRLEQERQVPLPREQEQELLQQVWAGKRLPQSLPLPQSPPPHSLHSSSSTCVQEQQRQQQQRGLLQQVWAQKQPAKLPPIYSPSSSTTACARERQERQLLRQAQLTLPLVQQVLVRQEAPHGCQHHNWQ